MPYKPGDSYYGYFTTRGFDDGVGVNADSLPTATMYKNGSSVGALTVANVTTGLYKVTGTIGAGYAKGDVIQVVASATVDGVSDKAVVDSFILDSKRVGDLNDAAAHAIPVSANITQVNGAGITIDDFKADLTTLENRLTEARAGYLDKLNIGAPNTLAHTGNASSFKADLSTLEARLSAARAGYLDKLNVAGDLANTANADSFKADVSGLALEATLQTMATAADLAAHDVNLDNLHTKHDATDVVVNAMDAKIDIIDTNVDTSLVEHDTTQAAIAALDVAGLAADHVAMTALINAIKVQTDKMQFNINNYIYAVGQNIAVGPGASAVTVSVNAGGLPLPDCTVWISSDAEGAQVVAGTLITDDQGDATFMLDEGLTYYLWARKSGYEPINGEAFTAVAD